jgi:predicted transcriptional regulator
MEATAMRTVTLEVASLDKVKRRVQEAMRGKRQPARISFATPELLWRILTPKRWELLKTMGGQGAMTLRELARRVRRDVKGVHRDAHALLDAGLIDRNEDGKLEFRYDAVRVEFELKAA